MKKRFNMTCGDINYFYIAAVVIIIHTVIWIFSGNSPLAENPYNSYVLQAQAWRDGSFDLGRGYSHLELAEYDYRFFVSFPQFPAMVYFIPVLLGLPVPEGIIALISAIAGACLCYKLGKLYNLSEKFSFILCLAMTVGSNMLFVSVNAWVWFIAQNMCFTLTVTSIVFAKLKKPFLSFLFLSFAIGCRPFQILYFPMLCMILCENSGLESLIKKPYVFLGAAIVGGFYMWLNFARFGNIFEFGHNYLPEFTEAQYGQFNIRYLKENLYSLIKLPGISQTGGLKMPRFNGMNIFIASPIFAYSIYMYIKNFRYNTKLKTAALLIILAELISITLHKTMGGWQFGNRYTNDCLPLALFIICASDIKKEGYPAGLSLLTLYGVLMNVAGTIVCYLDI